MSSHSIICALIPRFELLAASAGRRKLLSRPVALAPEPDREQNVGQASGPAEAFGIHAGMRVGEALGRCPDLILLPADPERAAQAWESVLVRLEGIGAAVESPRPGEVYFDAGGLRRLYGGHLEGVLDRTRRAIAAPLRLGAASSRFCSYAAASQARPRRGAKIVSAGAARAFLAPLPVAMLRARPELSASQRARVADLPTQLERLGVKTLGSFGALSAAAVADRFGTRGLRARGLTLGEDSPLRPRPLRQLIGERIDLPDGAQGFQLERALELLIDRLLAHPERRGRAFRKLLLGARFVEQGGWRREVTLRAATADRERLLVVLAPKLAELPAPIERLRLDVALLAGADREQLAFVRPDERERRLRLGEALRQVRAACGSASLLRVLEVDPRSRVPERRAILTPFPE
jgi:protein ImuB